MPRFDMAWLRGYLQFKMVLTIHISIYTYQRAMHSLVLHLRLLFLSMWTLDLYDRHSREAFDILKNREVDSHSCYLTRASATTETVALN